MPCAGQYRVKLGRKEITPSVYMADDVHGVVILRHWMNGGFQYERKEGKVAIIKTVRANQ